MSKSIEVNGRQYRVESLSKWTVAAFDNNGTKIATEKSVPKLIKKLELVEVTQDPVTPEDVVEALPAQRKSATQANRTSRQKAKQELESKKEKPSKRAVSMRQMTLNLMKAGCDDDEVLERILKEYPNRRYDRNHVKWYRSYFAKHGMLKAEFAPKGSKKYKQEV